MSTANTKSLMPVACQVIDRGEALRIERADGRWHRIEAEVLWSQCPSAAGRRRRMDGLQHRYDPGLRITKAELVGRYAVNIGFSDGHDRGVYPWVLLKQLAAMPSINDFIITLPDGCSVVDASTSERGNHSPSTMEK